VLRHVELRYCFTTYFSSLGADWLRLPRASHRRFLGPLRAQAAIPRSVQIGYECNAWQSNVDWRLYVRLAQRTSCVMKIRKFRLPITLSKDEVKAIDDLRFARRLPSRAAAIRYLLARGLEALNGFRPARGTRKPP
jgi:hypothetical protein